MGRRRIAFALAATLAWLGGAAAHCGESPPRAADQPLLATNIAALRKQVGQKVTVSGRIARTGRSTSGLQFLNFADSELTVVCRPEDVGKFRSGEPADLYRGQPIEIVGTVELYRGKVQIRLRDPAQIRIRKPREPPDTKAVTPQKPQEPQKPTPAGATTPFALRQAGKDVWVSPAGLRYQGRDPAGLSRLEHIRRHTADQPTRDGPHGVFDGGRDRAFAVIDEAWTRAQERRLRPTAEGERSSYTVDMGRRVGFLGGQVGAARRHPPLSRVFIVFETGTTNIITAFPK